jgi:Calx-beta domain
MRRLATAILIPIAAITWIAVLAPASPACANKQIYLRLADYEHTLGAFHPFYWAAEDEGSTSFTVERAGDNCDGTSATVDYDVENGTAQDGADFTRPPAPRRTIDLFDPFHGPEPHEDVVGVPIIDDGSAESVERANVVLSNPQESGGGAHLGDPATAPLYIVDDDAATDAFSFAESTYVHLERETDVALPVFRAGPATTSAVMTYAIDPGTTEGNDFIDSTGGSLTFDAGERMKLVRISLVNDGANEEDESFTVTLTGLGATGSPTEVTIANDDTGETQRPETKFHHPRHAHSYRLNDWRVQVAWHIFARDAGGSDVSKVQVALRKRSMSGSCSWLTRSGFEGGPCSSKRWITVRDRSALTDHPYDWIFVYDPRPKLRPSSGTSIRNYTIFSRATDGSGNVENSFHPSRNANTFEVTRR